VTSLPNGPYRDETIAQIRAAFIAAYLRVFAHLPPVDDIELINVRVAANEMLTERPVRLDQPSQQDWTIGADSREVWDAAAGRWRRLTVLARDMLPIDQELIGPIVLEEASSTLMIPDGAIARRDTPGNVIIDLSVVEKPRGTVEPGLNRATSA
jgi:N-methylhydantoinase A